MITSYKIYLARFSRNISTISLDCPQLICSSYSFCSATISCESNVITITLNSVTTKLDAIQTFEVFVQLNS